jgi:hypothetical protein
MAMPLVPSDKFPGDVRFVPVSEAPKPSSKPSGSGASSSGSGTATVVNGPTVYRNRYGTVTVTDEGVIANRNGATVKVTDEGSVISYRKPDSSGSSYNPYAKPQRLTEKQWNAQKTQLLQQSAVADLTQAGLIETKVRQTPQGPQYQIALTERGRNLGVQKMYELEQNAVWGKTFDFVQTTNGELAMYPEGTRDYLKAKGKNLNYAINPENTSMPRVSYGGNRYLVESTKGENEIKVREYDPFSNSLKEPTSIQLKAIVDLGGYEATPESKFSYSSSWSGGSIDVTNLKEKAASTNEIGQRIGVADIYNAFGQGYENPDSIRDNSAYYPFFTPPPEVTPRYGNTFGFTLPPGGAKNPNVINAFEVIARTSQDPPLILPNTPVSDFFNTRWEAPKTGFGALDFGIGYGVQGAEVGVKSVAAAGYWLGGGALSFGKAVYEKVEERQTLHDTYRRNEAVDYSVYSLAGPINTKLSYQSIGKLGDDVPLMIYTPESSGATPKKFDTGKLSELAASAPYLGAFPMVVGFSLGSVWSGNLAKTGVIAGSKATEGLAVSVPGKVIETGVSTGVKLAGIQAGFEFGYPAVAEFYNDFPKIEFKSNMEIQNEVATKNIGAVYPTFTYKISDNDFRNVFEPKPQPEKGIFEKSYRAGIANLQTKEAQGRIIGAGVLGFAYGAGSKVLDVSKPFIAEKKAQYVRAWGNIKELPFRAIEYPLELAFKAPEDMRTIRFFANSKAEYVNIPFGSEVWPHAQVANLLRVGNAGNFEVVPRPTPIQTIPVIPVMTKAIPRDEPLFSKEIKEMARTRLRYPKEEVGETEDYGYEILAYPSVMTTQLTGQRVGQIQSMKIGELGRVGGQRELLDLGLTVNERQLQVNNIRTATRVKLRENENQLQRQRELLDLGLIIQERQLQEVGQKQRIRTRLGTKTKQIKEQKVIFSPIPKFNNWNDESPFGFKAKKTDRKTKAVYAPSLVGLAYGAKASRTKGQFSGFEVRGMPGRRDRK